jgi:hypothetical protein
MERPPIFPKILVLALSLLSITVPSPASPGFGLVRKKEVILRTRFPAAVRLANTTIAFTGGFTNREYSPVAESLLTTLETELLKNESTLTKKNAPAEAEWTLSVKVTGYSLPNPQQTSQVSGKNTTTTVHWVGSLNVAYQVLDRSGHSHDAGNVAANYDKQFNNSAASGILTHLPGIGRHSSQDEKPPHTTEDVKQILIKDVVAQIASALGNTTKDLPVQVATGDDNLNESATFMEDKLWSRAVDKLEATPAYAKPEDEAFRQYDLGLAYEAMSYESKDFADQRENIYKAAEYYDKALELRPKEKYFVDSVARSKEALARYKAIEDQTPSKGRKTVTKSSAPAPVSPSGRPAPTTATPSNTSSNGAKVIRVGDVIDMFKEGVPQDQITDIIRNSPVEFDPHDKDTAISIAKAKLPLALQNELRVKVGAPRLGARAAAPQRPATTQP